MQIAMRFADAPLLPDVLVLHVRIAYFEAPVNLLGNLPKREFAQRYVPRRKKFF